jgi:hypothetical protein
MKPGVHPPLLRPASWPLLLLAILVAAAALLPLEVAQAKRVAFVADIDDYADISAEAQVQLVINDAPAMTGAASEALTQTPPHHEDNLVDCRLAGCASANSARTRLAALADVRKVCPMKLEARFQSTENALVSLRGLPATAVVSRGIDAGGGQWLLKPGTSHGLNATLPEGMPDHFRPELLLLREDVEFEFSDPVTLVIRISPTL